MDDLDIKNKNKTSVQKTDNNDGFFRVEKDLLSYGYFSVSSTHLTDKKDCIKGKLKKVVVLRKNHEGGEALAITRSYEDLGQPGNADLRLFLAMMKLIQDRPEHQHQISNPIKFKANEILRLIGKTKNKPNYQMVYKWLDRMTTTSIKLQGKITIEERRYYGEKGGWRFVDNYYLQGEEKPDGTIADSIEVYLTERALMNLNRYRTVPINFQAFLSLKNKTAQVLVPLLQIWFYSNPIFKKDYTDICQLLGIKEYKQASQRGQKFIPSLEELVKAKFLKEFKIEANNSKTGLNVILHAGANFYEALQYSKRTEINLPLENELLLQLPSHKTDKINLDKSQEQLYKSMMTEELHKESVLDLIGSVEINTLRRYFEYAVSRTDAAKNVASRKDYIFRILQKLKNGEEEVPVTFFTQAEQEIKEREKTEFIAKKLEAEQKVANLEMAFLNYLNEYYLVKYQNLSETEKETRRQEYLNKADVKESNRINNLHQETKIQELDRIAQCYLKIEDADNITFEHFLELDSEENLLAKYYPGNTFAESSSNMIFIENC